MTKNIIKETKYCQILNQGKITDVMRHRNLQQMSLKKTICFTAVKQKIEKTQLVLYLLCLLL
jgi:hypothetical protein